MENNGLNIYGYLLDTEFLPDSKIGVTSFVNTDSKIYVTQGVSSSLYIEYAAYTIQTDTSLVTFSHN